MIINSNSSSKINETFLKAHLFYTIGEYTLSLFMNFLAHAYLSGENEALLVGNFMGDFVKGDPHVQYNAQVANGVLLHRFIDETTDTHPIVKQSKIRARITQKHYAPVVIDIFYDHFLAKKWQNYHQMPLHEYAEWVYATLESHHDILPEKTRFMLPYMKKNNWLFNYQYIEGIKQAMNGMGRRASFANNMAEADVELTRNYIAYEKEFDAFFADLQIGCKRFISELSE
jgi:acyl carrier protein phosphodiesterase